MTKKILFIEICNFTSYTINRYLALPNKCDYFSALVDDSWHETVLKCS